MANIAVINCIALSDYAFKALPDGKSSFQRVLEYAASLPEVSAIHCVQGEEAVTLPQVSQEFETITGIKSVDDLLNNLVTLAKELGPEDSVIYFYGDTPFLDSKLSAGMVVNHQRYRADYTFADAYPVGMAPEILRISALGPLAKLAEGVEGRVQRNSLFEVLRKDINAFEIETEIPPLDLRLLRIALAAEDKAGYGLLSAIANQALGSAADMLGWLNENQKHLRTLPYYLSVQVTEGCRQVCTYCPYPAIAGDAIKSDTHMPLESFESILDQFISLSGKGYVNLSPWGEPSLHPQIEEVVAAICRRGLIAVIETSGLGWKKETLESLAAEYSEAITWIVSLDANSEAVYRKLRGTGFSEAKMCSERLLELFPKTAFIQAVRMDTNEEELELFYRYWKEKTENIIIQKYDYFSGYLPQRRIADISPYNRHACWHMKRDLTVLLNGDVPVCREDLKNAHLLGNLFTDGIESVWRKGEEYYEKHLKGDLLDICRECDEYYTYNY